jgi:hypothetical protein
LAPGITALVESRTVPVIWALADCAIAVSAALNSTATRQINNATFLKVDLLQSETAARTWSSPNPDA